MRLPNVPALRAWMDAFFRDTLLPGWLVAPFATAIPYVEFGLGLLLSGLFIKPALVMATAVLEMLVLGSCLKEQ